MRYTFALVGLVQALAVSASPVQSIAGALPAAVAAANRAELTNVVKTLQDVTA